MNDCQGYNFQRYQIRINYTNLDMQMSTHKIKNQNRKQNFGSLARINAQEPNPKSKEVCTSGLRVITITL